MTLEGTEGDIRGEKQITLTGTNGWCEGGLTCPIRGDREENLGGLICDSRGKSRWHLKYMNKYCKCSLIKMHLSNV